MTLLKTAFTSAAMLAGGLFAMTPENADAQIRFQIGGGNGYSYGSGYNNGYGGGSRSHAGHDHGGSGYRSNVYSNNYGVGGNRYDSFSGGQRYGSGYRGTNGFRQSGGHYDYHPTTVVPHGNHYHVQPGHYDYHQSGHRH